MSRKLLVLASVIVGLHIVEALTLGTSTLGSFLANGLQIFACGFAAVMAFGASRRGRGLSRTFWLIFGASIAMWGVANLGWMYYEVVLHSEPPATSAVRFLFGLESVLIAITLFLDQDKDSPRIDPESALDFIQIGIVFFFIYLEYYYVPHSCGRCASRTWKMLCLPSWLLSRRCARGNSTLGNFMAALLFTCCS
jgi:hypothetical protein